MSRTATSDPMLFPLSLGPHRIDPATPGQTFAKLAQLGTPYTAEDPLARPLLTDKLQSPIVLRESGPRGNRPDGARGEGEWQGATVQPGAEPKAKPNGKERRGRMKKDKRSKKTKLRKAEEGLPDLEPRTVPIEARLAHESLPTITVTQAGERSTGPVADGSRAEGSEGGKRDKEMALERKHARAMMALRHRHELAIAALERKHLLALAEMNRRQEIAQAKIDIWHQLWFSLGAVACTLIFIFLVL